MNKTREYNETKTDLFEEYVLAKKDLDKAITDRAQWRADERRWCREGTPLAWNWGCLGALHDGRSWE